MATNVTVTRVYANPDHFQGKNTPQYVYSGAASSQGGGIQWLGSTLNAVGTYTAPGYITANDDMLWDGDLLSLGTKLTAAKQAADVVVQVGSVDEGAHGAVEIIGNQIINGTIGTLSFHNEASAHARNTVAELAVTRVGDADSGQITLKLADSDANLDDVYIVSELFHNWAVAGVSEMWLSDAALYPNTVGGLTLGTSGAPWGAAFAASALLTGMATTGNRMVYADSTGLLTDLSWLTWSGAGTLEIGTGLTFANFDFEYGGANPYSFSADAANGLYIHEYSTNIAKFTTALVTVVSPVRMEDLASTGNRIMFADADGDVSAPDWLTISGISILEIGTGLTYSSLALEFGGANPYELSANDTDGMFIHLYSDRIMTFTDTLITTAVDVRMDSLAGTGDRMVVADADGDLSTQAIPVIDPMVYPGTGIPSSTGTAWGTSLAGSSAIDTVETTLTDDDTHLPTSGAVYAAIAGAGGMVYPGAGIAVSTGSAWGTSLTDNSTNWNTAYSHSQIVTGNPHAIGYADISDFNTGVSTYETSHATVVIDADFTSQGIMLRGATTGSYSILTDNSANWNTAFGWGDHSTLYDTTGTAAGLISTHESTYNHTQFQTAYTHSQVTTGNPHQVDWSELTGSQPAPISHTLLSHTITGETLGHVLAADSATTYSIRQLLGSEINNDLGWSTNAGSVTSVGLSLPSEITVTNSPVTAAGTLTGTWANAAQNAVFAGPSTGGVGTPSFRSLVDVDMPSSYDATNWDTAYGWGDHDGLYDPINTASGLISTHESTYNHGQFQTAYTHSQVTTGNPHSVEWTELGGARSGISLSGFDDDLTYNNYTHPNHSGQVTSTGDGATVVTVSAITAQTALTSGLASTDELLVNDGGVIKRMDISVIQDYMQSELTSDSPFTRTGAEISPTYTNDSILLRNSNEKLKFGDGDTYFSEVTDDSLRLYVGGLQTVTFGTQEMWMSGGIFTSGSKVHDIGTSTGFFNDVYVDRIYIDNVNTYIDVSGTDMTLTSADAGTVLLSNLTGGATGGSITGIGIGSLISSTTCPDNATTNITVGTTALDEFFTVHYIAERGSEKQSGTIMVMYDDNGPSASYSSEYIGADLGFGIEADLSSGSIRLNIIVDNSSTDDVVFEGYFSKTGTTSGVYLGVDGTNNLTLTDSVTGTKTLAALASGSGTSVWTRSGTSLSPTTAGDDILLTTATEKIVWTGGAEIYETSANNLYIDASSTNVNFAPSWTMFWKNIYAQNTSIDIGSSTTFFNRIYASTLYIDDTSTSIALDASNNITFTDAVTGTKTLADLAGGGSSPWTKTSTNLSPTTAGDDILLATNTERLTFAGGSWVREGSAGTLGLSGGGADRMTISGSAITAGAPLRPDSNNFRDLGLTTHYWKDLFIKKIYVDNANAFITVNWVDTGEMTLTDGNTGTHTLAELASGHKVIRIQHSDDGTTLDIADLGLGDVAWSDISIMMYVVTAFDSTAPQLHIGNTAHTSTYYLAAGDPGWATTGFKTFTLSNDPNFISGDETINCQYNDSTSDGTVGDAYLYFSYISS